MTAELALEAERNLRSRADAPMRSSCGAASSSTKTKKPQTGNDLPPPFDQVWAFSEYGACEASDGGAMLGPEGPL
ncbi:hypothetical protein EYF80_034351 [Liparis tanakae]|uniref:Uncharacterized protein n=1 Tax=Liparis tanakae TaxID=230148 RepID=A0A4Z2GQ34_9TELE|nr:hypothetical protein EYF80_034351 [Liparis tanakae]